jgi:hypothetical protein
MRIPLTTLPVPGMIVFCSAANVVAPVSGSSRYRLAADCHRTIDARGLLGIQQLGIEPGVGIRVIGTLADVVPAHAIVECQPAVHAPVVLHVPFNFEEMRIRHQTVAAFRVGLKIAKQRVGVAVSGIQGIICGPEALVKSS